MSEKMEREGGDPNILPPNRYNSFDASLVPNQQFNPLFRSLSYLITKCVFIVIGSMVRSEASR